MQNLKKQILTSSNFVFEMMKLKICDCLEQQQYYSLKDQYFKVDHRIAWNNNDGDTSEHPNHPDFQGHLLLVPAFHPRL